MNKLIEKFKNKESGILLYGLTPPKAGHTPEKLKEISDRRISRLKDVTLDGIILYDIQDEQSRNSEERPFPFLETVDPISYKNNYFSELNLPTIFYQCVGKYSKEEISGRLRSLENQCSVLVGSSSRNENISCSISDAYTLAKDYPQTYLGGVTIPERHAKKGNEHERLIRKQENGVQFFISQFIFNMENLKNMISEYYYFCQKNNFEMAPIIFTVTPCGSQKTLDLLDWLGVHIPTWIKNDLLHSHSTLDMSMELCLNSVDEMARFCMDKKIPFGCNIESVSVRKDEVLASFELVKMIEEKFKSLGLR